MLVTELYKQRCVTARGIHTFGDWRLKVYGISYDAAEPGAELVDAALGVAKQTLPSPALSSSRYGVGFLGIHQGRSANVVFLDWWEDETDLLHNTFISTFGQPALLRPSRRDEVSACVWDVAVFAHERAAWIEHVLANTNGPDLDGYLADVLEGPV